jgi:hypothetical protein
MAELDKDTIVNEFITSQSRRKLDRDQVSTMFDEIVETNRPGTLSPSRVKSILGSQLDVQETGGAPVDRPQAREFIPPTIRRIDIENQSERSIDEIEASVAEPAVILSLPLVELVV